MRGQDWRVRGCLAGLLSKKIAPSPSFFLPNTSSGVAPALESQLHLQEYSGAPKGVLHQNLESYVLMEMVKNYPPLPLVKKNDSLLFHSTAPFPFLIREKNDSTRAPPESAGRSPPPPTLEPPPPRWPDPPLSKMDPA